MNHTPTRFLRHQIVQGSTKKTSIGTDVKSNPSLTTPLEILWKVGILECWDFTFTYRRYFLKVW